MSLRVVKATDEPFTFECLVDIERLQPAAGLVFEPSGIMMDRPDGPTLSGVRISGPQRLVLAWVVEAVKRTPLYTANPDGSVNPWVMERLPDTE